MSKRATQRDVALRAGVSPATVSYIINNQTGGNISISQDTRQRVMKAVHELNYLPDITARGLSTRKTQLLAVMLPDITDPFYTLVFRGAQAVAESQGYDLMVYDVDLRSKREKKFIDTVLRRRVDGVIMLTTFTTSEDVNRLLEADIQVAIVGHSPDIKGGDRVGLDEMDGVHQVMEHLYGRGHRRIAFLTGPLDWLQARTRKAGYVRSLQEMGLKYEEDLVREGTFQREGTSELVESLFGDVARANPPTALFCSNDNMAIEAVRTLTKMGFRVPDDVAVAGFDNIPQAEAMIPGLTTLDHIPMEMGKAATTFLLERINSDASLPDRKKILTGKLIVRETT